MSTFTNFAIKGEYERIAELGDRLGEVEKTIDWEKFRPIIKGEFRKTIKTKSTLFSCIDH